MISEKLNPMSPCLGTSKPVEEIWAAEISRLKSKTAASVKSGKHDVRTVPELASSWAAELVCLAKGFPIWPDTWQSLHAGWKLRKSYSRLAPATLELIQPIAKQKGLAALALIVVGPLGPTLKIHPTTCRFAARGLAWPASYLLSWLQCNESSELGCLKEPFREPPVQTHIAWQTQGIYPNPSQLFFPNN